MDSSPTTGLSLMLTEESSIRCVFWKSLDLGLYPNELMESSDSRVRLYGSTAVVTGLTTTKGKFMGQDFTSCERATDVFVKQDDRWLCVLTQLTRFNKK